MTAMNKAELRRMLRIRFEGENPRNEQSAHICRHIIESEIYKHARVIGGYMPMPREADITPVLRNALAQGKKLALPLCGLRPDMTFHLVDNLDILQPNVWRIPEPGENDPLVPMKEIDLLLVPLEGIDHDGYRLGKGGGYYDKALQNQAVFTLGCALTWQWTKEVPREAHDVRLNGCVDADGIHIFGTTDRNEVYSNGQEEAED